MDSTLPGNVRSECDKSSYKMIPCIEVYWYTNKVPPLFLTVNPLL